jgi:hypothetical protein
MGLGSEYYPECLLLKGRQSTNRLERKLESNTPQKNSRCLSLYTHALRALAVAFHLEPELVETQKRSAVAPLLLSCLSKNAPVHRRLKYSQALCNIVMCTSFPCRNYLHFALQCQPLNPQASNSPVLEITQAFIFRSRQVLIHVFNILKSLSQTERPVSTANECCDRLQDLQDGGTR